MKTATATAAMSASTVDNDIVKAKINGAIGSNAHTDPVSRAKPVQRSPDDQYHRRDSPHYRKPIILFENTAPGFMMGFVE